MTVSLAMIVKNEAEVLPRLLPDVLQLVDEIVIVDTGSTDNTKEVIHQFGSDGCPILVFDFEWINDFSAARNYALEQCTKDWIMVLDADDVIPDVNAMRKVIEKLPEFNVDAVVMPYRVWMIDTMNVRFVRRSSGMRYKQRIHESFDVSESRGGIVTITDVYVHHGLRPGQDQDVPINDGKHRALMQEVYDSGDHSLHILFYLARELHAAGEFPFALWKEYFSLNRAKPAANMDYTAYLLFAECLDQLSPSMRLGQGERFRAAQLSPSRAEAWMELGRSHQIHEEYEEAIPYFTAALGCRRPPLGFILNDDYTWTPHDGLMFCHAKLGEYAIALQHARAAVQKGADAALMQGNIDAIERQLNRKVATAV